MQITTHDKNARLVKSGETVNSYLLQNLRAIGDDARPLAVRFLTDNVAFPKIADEIAWCVAAAFFRHKGVI